MFIPLLEPHDFTQLDDFEEIKQPITTPTTITTRRKTTTTTTTITTITTLTIHARECPRMAKNSLSKRTWFQTFNYHPSVMNEYNCLFWYELRYSSSTDLQVEAQNTQEAVLSYVYNSLTTTTTRIFPIERSK